MSVRDTSLQAYFVEVTPELGKRQKEVYEALGRLGMATNTELARLLGWGVNRVTPRVYELRGLGKTRDGYRNVGPCLVVDAGTRPCMVTGRLAHVWKIK